MSSQTNYQTVEIFFPEDFSGCSWTIMARLKGSAFISLLALLPSLAGVPTYVSLDLFIDHIALLSSFGGLNIFLICILYVIQLET